MSFRNVETSGTKGVGGGIRGWEAVARAWRRRKHGEGWNFGETYFSVNGNK